MLNNQWFIYPCSAFDISMLFLMQTKKNAMPVQRSQPIKPHHPDIFFLEHVEELRIFILRGKKGYSKLQSPAPLLGPEKGCRNMLELLQKELLIWVTKDRDAASVLIWFLFNPCNVL